MLVPSPAPMIARYPQNTQIGVAGVSVPSSSSPRASSSEPVIGIHL